ncbi:MAG: hypothetical protein GEU73_01675 [Chloroflexi bacterium]|nr:hypothetical protein [Chloroflexota bacterium]
MDDPSALPERGELRRALGVPDARPFVFATVGGALAREQYVRALVRGLEEAGVAAICSVGTRLGEATIGELNRPPVRVVRFLPDDLQAMRAADALIWHGGHETMLKAVACGIPAVGVPMQFDQESNVRMLERAGAGLRIAGEDGRPERIAEAVGYVLNKSRYRLAAERLAATNRQVGGAPGLMDRIERLAA